ncbi:hypothetical protein CTAYLR_001850 [Chrysophaeum taylorii]|uniref:Glycosyl transferase CAP10 domain-containing protein n=1 Tax=Chrysophaeum taylorii TaxID=2483200 RepID=A0AAD7XHZ7_9STRA|nr:hypothetical protein CTAYLR_001850 [Chrysophaeum taylorii]
MLLVLLLFYIIVVVVEAVAWQPELRSFWEKESSKDDAGALVRAVRLELKRSLQVYPQLKSRDEAWDFLSKTTQRREDYVLIMKNRVFVDEAFIRIDKNNRHLQFVYSVTRVRELPDVAYLINRFAFGDRHPYPRGPPHFKPPCAREGGGDVDFELVISKYHGYEQCGVLIPNMYNFNELAKWNATTRTLAKAAKIRWKERQDLAFWRGQILAQDKCHRDHGNYARWQALALSRRYPEDLACHCLDGKPCKFRNDTKTPCVDLPYDETMRALHEEPREHHSEPMVGLEEFANYKFLLNIPGTISGSYSRHLNVLWSLAAVVLLWDSPHVEWYYPALRSGVTHVSVSAASVRDVILRLKNDHARAATLAYQAKRVHDLFLCADCVAHYFHLVLHAVAKRFALATVFDDNNSLVDDNNSLASSREKRKTLLRQITKNDLLDDDDDGGGGVDAKTSSVSSSRLLEVRFSSDPETIVPPSKSTTKSTPYMFVRRVAPTDEGGLAPTSEDFRLADWRPGKGA